MENAVPFFDFSQNNSGGSFDSDHSAGLSHYVIIEADSASDANDKARDIGLYFGGAGDCSCCGNRWREQWDDEDGDDVPSIYGTPISDFEFGHQWIKDGPEAYVHFADGQTQGYGLELKSLS